MIFLPYRKSKRNTYIIFCSPYPRSNSSKRQHNRLFDELVSLDSASFHPRRGWSRGCPASRDAISAELIGELGMDKAEKAGLEVGGRDSGAERRGKGTCEDGKSQDDPRMSPDISCSEIDFTPAMPRATSVRERGKIGERGKKKEKGKKGIRERNSQNAPSIRFVPFPRSLEIRWFSARILQSRDDIREKVVLEEEFRRRIRWGRIL